MWSLFRRSSRAGRSAPPTAASAPSPAAPAAQPSSPSKEARNMNEWNAMTYEGKNTILRVVRNEAQQMFEMAERPGAWDAPTACTGWSTRDVIAHIVDTTEGYFRAFDAARSGVEAPPPHGLVVMSQLVDKGASALRDIPQA